ncbi:hypothetical protein GG344DRAFT_68239 [Lentinula edodes]|nr:hypothetical protein GG344DRAFT_68239 [Lentinula edodes]
MAVPINVDTTLGFLSHAVVLCCILYGVKGIAGLFKLWWRQSSYATRVKLDFSTCSELTNAFVLEDQGNPLALAKLDPNLIIELIFSGMIAFLVQHFYCYRIYALSKSWLLSGFVSGLVTLYYFIGVVLSQYTELAQLALLDNVSIVTNVLGIVSDFAITFLMIFLLQRSKTGFKNTTDVLNRLIVFTFNTGQSHLLFFISNETGTFEYWSRHTDFTMLHRDFNSGRLESKLFTPVLTFMELEGVPGTFIYIFVYVSMGRFYTNCLLVTLNSRDYIRQGLNSDLTSTSENYALSIPNNPLESRLEFAGTNSTTDGISIRIDRDIHTSSSKTPTNISHRGGLFAKYPGLRRPRLRPDPARPTV